MKRLVVTTLCAALLVAGCAMGTPADRILPARVSEEKFQDMKCKDLKIEYESLVRREQQLTAAQDSRYRSSRVQAIIWGVGKGDGAEASELAEVRGDLEAMQRVMARKDCSSK